MDKPAETNHDVHALIRERWSPRAFAARAVDDGVVRALFEAARWAPSCRNEQPWRFIVARHADSEDFRRMLSCLDEGNQRWANAAPLLALSVASTTFARNGKPNRHAWHDVGLAAGQLCLQATALGLQVHQMAGFSPDRAREQYAIPDGFEPVAAMAIGYPGDPDGLPEDLRERERAGRKRRPQSDVVFAGGWQVPL